MTSGSPDGLDMLQDRIVRRQRTVRPPRHPKQSTQDAPAPTPAASDPVQEDPPPPDVAPAELETAAAKGERRRRAELIPDEPRANLAVRVRRSLDTELAEALLNLRRQGTRSSKAEVIEMLLWELPGVTAADLERRLVAYRRAVAQVDEV